MAKHKVYLHIGPPVPGVDATHRVLGEDGALAEAGVVVPAVDQEEMDRADVEIRRRHKALGLRRKDVEGAWARVCRKAFKAKDDVLVSQPAFVHAAHQQAALALDGLVGLQLHLVVTPGTAPDDAGLAELLGPWGRFVRKPGRIHVLPVGEAMTADELGAGMARLVLHAQRDDVERRLVTLKKQRRSIRNRLGKVDAA